MTIISNNQDAIFHGLSSFWQTLFRDFADLKALYEGTEYLMGQAYLNMLSDVLNISVLETPLFNKEYYKLITFSADQISFSSSPSAYRVFTPDVISNLGILQNNVVSPTSELENGLDFTLATNEIRFVTNPLNQNNYAGGLGLASYLPGYVVKHIQINVAGTLKDYTLTNLWGQGVRSGDTLTVSSTQAISLSPPDAQVFKIATVTPDAIYILAGSQLPSPLASHYYYNVTRTNIDNTTDIVLVSTGAQGVINNTITTTLVPQITMWGVDVRVDNQDLYNSFGRIINQKDYSSEVYRNLIRGIMQLYVFGPTLKRLQSGLNVVAGLPVIASDGEVLTNYQINTPSAGLKTVTTNVNTYVFPSATPLRTDVTNSANYGVLSFQAFEALTNAIIVDDYLTNPTWWFRIKIPASLLPGKSDAYLRVSPELYPNVVNGADGGCVGDPGLFVGANEDGTSGPSTGTYLGVATYTNYHHKASFVLMNDFLKTHMFNVIIDTSVTNASQVRALVLEVKPAHTTVVFNNGE